MEDVPAKLPTTTKELVPETVQFADRVGVVPLLIMYTQLAVVKFAGDEPEPPAASDVQLVNVFNARLVPVLEYQNVGGGGILKVLELVDVSPVLENVMVAPVKLVE